MPNKSFTAADVKTVSLEDHFARNPEIYFGTRGPNPQSIAASVAEGALVLGATKTTISSLDGWWFVCADKDWLSATRVSNENEYAVFERLCAFPEAGDNSLRAELLCRLYSDATFTVCGNALHRVKGSKPAEPEALRMVESLGNWERVVAFRFRDAI